MHTTFRSSFQRWWLLVSAHLDALLLAPGAYLTAAKWRLFGKRVRARAQFAPLLSRSRRAYDLWLMSQGNPGPASAADAPPIVALVFGDGGEGGLAATLASLAGEKVEALVIAADQPNADLGWAAAQIDWAAGPWLMPLSAGDRLTPGAARAYREAMRETGLPIIYADDDSCDPRGGRSAPHFKPDWNAELFRHHDYLTGSCVLRTNREALVAAGPQPDWAHTLVSTAVGDGGGAHHLRQILHHRWFRPAPRLPLHALPTAPRLPRISAIIPTRNRADLLATCIDGLEAADYSDLEVIVVDNDSDEAATFAFLEALPARSRPGRAYRVLRHPGPFNYSAINNRAVTQAGGELICLLNNDLEMLQPDWLAIMATQALREEVGAVGAALLYPDGRIQHAGVVIGVGNAAGHAHRLVRPDEEGYFRRHALPQFVAAVTAACLVVKRERFLAVSGLDESNFAVAFNDVDLCLRLNGRGWQSFYEPRAVLMHHESVSRGLDRDPVGAARFAGELAALQRLHATDRIVDRFHHPDLSRASEQFVLAL
ncbi:MAG: glycosyl transferase [Alphaproteobacteria bacterium PA3]|nr:MAG: glycosyl transferase [Alphaproteobacteria bacterium PA3]